MHDTGPLWVQKPEPCKANFPALAENSLDGKDLQYLVYTLLHGARYHQAVTAICDVMNNAACFNLSQKQDPLLAYYFEARPH